MKRKKKVQYAITEYVEKPVTKKEFFRVQKERATEGMISQVQLLKSGTLNKNEIDRLVRNKLIVPNKYRSRVYFKKDQVLRGLKYLGGQPKLISK